MLVGKPNFGKHRFWNNATTADKRMVVWSDGRMDGQSDGWYDGQKTNTLEKKSVAPASLLT